MKEIAELEALSAIDRFPGSVLVIIHARGADLERSSTFVDTLLELLVFCISARSVVEACRRYFQLLIDISSELL